LTDIVIPERHKLQKIWHEKCNKYQYLAIEVKNVWKQTAV
jgi:hypothetical protein